MRPSSTSKAASGTRANSRNSSPTRGRAGPATVTSWPMLTTARDPAMLFLSHRHFNAAFARGLLRQLVTRIGVANHTETGIVVQYARNFSRSHLRAIGYSDLSGVQRIPHAHAAAMVEADPCSARRGIQQCVQDRPVGNRIRPVKHLLCLAIRTGHGACIQVVAAYRNRRGDLPLAHQFVDSQKSVV